MNVKETFVMAAKMLYRKHQSKIKKAKESLMAKRRGDKLRRDTSGKPKNSASCSC